jgi:hypothetical protein
MSADMGGSVVYLANRTRNAKGKESIMAQKEGKCGTATISYDEKCTWICMCAPGQACIWQVVCPDGNGGTTTEGTGLENGHSSHPTVNVAGILELVAFALSKVWHRSVKCPSELAKKKVKRTLRGSQEEVARALGLQLGAKGRRS